MDFCSILIDRIYKKLWYVTIYMYVYIMYIYYIYISYIHISKCVVGFWWNKKKKSKLFDCYFKLLTQNLKYLVRET